MVHPTENPSAAEATKPVEQEEFTGAFGFFRKYQKPILYTAGMFALVTFSVTGAMMSSFDRMFRGDVPRASIVVNNTRVKLEDEDFYYGIQLAQGRYAPTVVLPVLGDAGGADSELQDTYAILRRAALTEGLDVSDKEVDDAIKFARESVKAATDQELAARVGSSSLAAYRSVVREAMRIGNYVRLHALAADGSDAALIRELLDGLEKVELRVATLDGKALEEGLRREPSPRTTNCARGSMPRTRTGRTSTRSSTPTRLRSRSVPSRWNSSTRPSGRRSSRVWTSVRRSRAASTRRRRDACSR